MFHGRRGRKGLRVKKSREKRVLVALIIVIHTSVCMCMCDFASWQWYWRAVGRKLARVAFTREPLPHRDTLYPVLPGSFVLDNFVRARDWKEEKEEFNWTGNTNRSGLFRRLSEINNDGENNILPRYLIESIVFDKMELQGSARLEQSCN